MSSNQLDVLVIGAGFAGLSAALALKQNGLKTCILEARERVGGRVKTRYTSDGTQIPLGGQWIGPTQDYMYELVEKYQIEVFATKTEGKDIVKYNGHIVDKAPKEIDDLYDKLDKLAETVNLEQPWLTPDAKVLDGETFASWLQRESATPQAASFVARVLAGGLLATDAAECSVLQMLFYIKSGHGITSLTGVQGGAQQDRVMGGLEYIADKMAEDFGEENILFSHPVRRIIYHDDHVEVVTDRDRYFAKRAILAIPLAVMNQIEFTPQLPILKHKVLSHTLAPGAFKVHLVFQKPFWNDFGLSGNSTFGSGYIFEAYNNTVVDNGTGVLSFFSYGNEADELRAKTIEERKAIFLGELEPIFGKGIHDYLEYIEYDWSEQLYTRGCFSSHFSPNGWYTLGEEFNKNVGPLYWAGAEFAIHWNGYADGAVRSGKEVAHQVFRSIK
ncbi:FAD-dependent oxidoreductase [Utexia brackfieldae]|uniref:flavin monoamine oxidase family protein n=1 Tax=Utexia brackfieldae TaxID=3074108 RepID=UPI00370D74DC